MVKIVIIGIGIYLLGYIINLFYPYYEILLDDCVSIHYPNSFLNGYGKGKELPTFTFIEFIDFYNLNQDLWYYYNWNDKLAPIPALRNEVPTHIMNTEYDYHPIFFTNAFEYKKYRKWAKLMLKNKNKNDSHIAKAQAKKEILERVQKDERNF